MTDLFNPFPAVNSPTESEQAKLDAEQAALKAQAQAHNEQLADDLANQQGVDTKPAAVSGLSDSDITRLNQQLAQQQSQIEQPQGQDTKPDVDSTKFTPENYTHEAVVDAAEATKATDPIELDSNDIGSPLFGLGLSSDEQAQAKEDSYELRFRVDRDTHVPVQQASLYQPTNEAERAVAADQRQLDIVANGKTYLKASPSPGGREVGKWFVARNGLPVSAVEFEDSWQQALDNVEPFQLVKPLS